MPSITEDDVHDGRALLLVSQINQNKESSVCCHLFHLVSFLHSMLDTIIYLKWISSHFKITQFTIWVAQHGTFLRLRKEGQYEHLHWSLVLKAKQKQACEAFSEVLAHRKGLSVAARSQSHHGFFGFQFLQHLPAPL